MAAKIYILGFPGRGKSKVARRIAKHSKNQKGELIVIVIELRAKTTSDQSPASLVTDPPLSKTFRSWIPTNEKNAFFTLIALIYLVIAVLHWCMTGDISMFNYLLGAVAGWAGVKEIVSKINQGKDKTNH